MPRLTMVHGLFGTLIVCAGFAVYKGTQEPAAEPPPPSVASPPSPSGVALDGLPDESPEAPSVTTVEGDVLEVLDVPEYTYARLGEKGSEGKWTAFTSTKIVVGQHLKLVDAVLMTDFSSKILKRTFPTIWFGNLSNGDAPVDNPHAGMTGSMAATEGGGDPQSAIAIHPVDKATGPNGKTIAEIFAGRTELAGKKVLLRAIVVKKTAAVLGHDYLHLRDGSGDEASHNNDLSVTIDAPVEPGDTVLIEGKLMLDVDIDSGYVFPTLLSDAHIVVP